MNRAITIGAVAMIALALAFAGCAPAGKYKDGAYSATYDAYDAFGWKPRLEFDVKGGRVASATFDYVNRNGQLKSRDEQYASAMKQKTGTTPADAAAALVGELLARQQGEVDAVSGATETSANFNELTAALFAKAATGDRSSTVLPMNATYHAQNEDFDAHGWKAVLSVKFENGRVTAVGFDEIDKDNNRKSNDEAYAAQMSKVSKATPKEVYTALAQKLLDAQDPDRVDAVSGATSTSKTFVDLARQIFAARQ